MATVVTLVVAAAAAVPVVVVLRWVVREGEPPAGDRKHSNKHLDEPHDGPPSRILRALN